MANEVAERYARGLFELALEDGTVETKSDQAQGLLEVIHINDDLQTLLHAVKITKAEKKAIVESVFADSFDADMIRFLKLLIDKGRIGSLKEILHEYVKLANEELGIEEAVVWSARKLKDEDIERIKASLVKKRGKKILITNKIDPKLIAGIKVTVGNNVTDATMKHRIDSMKESMLKGGLPV